MAWQWRRVTGHTNAGKHLSRTLLCAGVLATAACTSIEPVDRSLYHQAETLQNLAHNQPEIDGPLSLEEALARGFSYNPTFQTQRLKAFQALNEVGLSQAEYLPRATAAIGAVRRSNVQASVGQSVDDMGNDLPTDFFTASDQSRTYGNLSASWNLIDFGVSYLENEKQKRLAENEQETARISCAALSGEIVEAFWRAKAYDRAEAKNKWLKWRINTALALAADRAEITPELRAGELLLQRELIDLFRWYDSIYVSLSGSKAQLASLINLPAGVQFSLDDEQPVAYLNDLPESDIELVKLAFLNRPELRQRLLFDEVHQISGRQDFVRLFPSLSILFGAEQDSNSFLLNNSFSSIGASLSWNLYDLARSGERRQKNEDRTDFLKLETEIVASAIASQVAMAINEYRARNATLEYAWRANTIQAEIASDMQAAFERGEMPETYYIKEELLRELSIIRRDVDEAGHQAARMRVLNALGLGPDCQQ
ncbi:MAG: hypothetical protein Hens3KO_28670 [Henriciella sp.]